MPEVRLNYTSSEINERLAKAGQIGDLNQLETEDKSSLVAAINEAAQSGGAQQIVNLADYVDALTIEGGIPIPQGSKFGQNIPMNYSRSKYIFDPVLPLPPSVAGMIRFDAYISNIDGREDRRGFTVWMYLASDKSPLGLIMVGSDGKFLEWILPTNEYYFGNLSLNNDGNLTDAPYYRDGQPNDKTYARKDGKWVSIDKTYLTKDDLDVEDGEYTLELTQYDCDVYLDWSAESDTLYVFGTNYSGNWAYKHEATIVMSGENIAWNDAAYLVGEKATNEERVYVAVLADNTVVYGERKDND